MVSLIEQSLLQPSMVGYAELMTDSAFQRAGISPAVANVLLSTFTPV